MRKILNINLGIFSIVISSLQASQTSNNMANIKSITFFAFLSFGLLTYNPVMGQAATRSDLDFFLTFAELLTTDIVNGLTSVQLPPIIIPDLPTFPQFPSFQFPNFQFPNLNFPDINIPNISFPGFPNLSGPGAPTPAPQTSPGYDAYIKYLTELYKLYNLPVPSFPTLPPVTAAPVTPAPTQPPATAAPCNGCKPEKVRIIVVDDCDENKSKSSESSEESDEVDIIVPYTNRGRLQHKKKANKK